MYIRIATPICRRLLRHWVIWARSLARPKVGNSNAAIQVYGTVAAAGANGTFVGLSNFVMHAGGVLALDNTIATNGDRFGDATPLLREITAGLSAGSNVRGALVGRNVLYPGAEDPLVVAQAIGLIIHDNWTVECALDAGKSGGGRDVNEIANYFPPPNEPGL